MDAEHNVLVVIFAQQHQPLDSAIYTPQQWRHQYDR